MFLVFYTFYIKFQVTGTLISEWNTVDISWVQHQYMVHSLLNVHSVPEHVVMSYKLWDCSSVFVSLIALQGLSLGKIFEVNLGEGSWEASRATWILDSKSAFAWRQRKIEKTLVEYAYRRALWMRAGFSQQSSFGIRESSPCPHVVHLLYL